MSYYRIQKKDKTLKGEVFLPSSKSISNRLLIIDALYAEQALQIHNLSTANDTKIMQKALALLANHQHNTPHTLDIEDAGTAFRFLTAYAATQAEQHLLLTGTPRMQERPIGHLVNALRQLGADISYTAKQGYPPLLIKGKALLGHQVHIKASVSSQFISALMLIAPRLPQGLRICLEGTKVSAPYIHMTAKLMQYFGMEVNIKKTEIHIAPHHTTLARNSIRVESDWSAASYWYQMAALAEEADIFLHGLQADSLQGDAAIAQWFEPLGVESTFGTDGVRLRKMQSHLPAHFTADFTHQPDMAQTMACTLSGLQCPATLTGLGNLRHKETDRLTALATELSKLKVNTKVDANSLHIAPHNLSNPQQPIQTYNDHRMAMAFAPLAIPMNYITIAQPECVQKSYPSFWTDLQKVGFEITTTCTD